MTARPRRRTGVALASLLLITACADEQTTKVASSGLVGAWRGRTESVSL